MVEALMDPKTWLFALFSALDNIPTSVVNQLQIIVVSFGFNPLQTTLLSCGSGGILIMAILSGVTIASRIPNSTAWVAIAYFVPNILGVFLVNLLPWHNKVGLLLSVWMTGTHDGFYLRRGSSNSRESAIGTTALVLSFAWVSQTTAGHTKKVTTNAIMLSANCIGNAAGPFMWREKYKPR